MVICQTVSRVILNNKILEVILNNTILRVGLNNTILLVAICRTVKLVVSRKVLDDGLKLPESVVVKNNLCAVGQK